jgi:hypothetical protein
MIGYLLVASGAAILGFALRAMMRGSRREKPGPGNNWRNEDHMSREADGTWSEGSTYSKSASRDSTGLGF